MDEEDQRRVNADSESAAYALPTPRGRARRRAVALALREFQSSDWSVQHDRFHPPTGVRTRDRIGDIAVVRI
jgi:hypothetical protein